MFGVYGSHLGPGCSDMVVGRNCDLEIKSAFCLLMSENGVLDLLTTQRGIAFFASFEVKMSESDIMTYRQLLGTHPAHRRVRVVSRLL